MQDAANLMREFAQNGASGSSGRPSMPEPFAVHIAHWLREDPDVSGAEILRCVRRVGYHGGKRAPYELVKRQRTLKTSQSSSEP